MKQRLWFASSLFLLLVCSWFAIMEFVLRHPRFEMRALIALLIAYFALLCLRYASNPHAALRPILTICAIATLTVGIFVMRLDLRSTHFEGYILLIALVLITHSLLSLINTVPRPRLHPA